MLLTLFILGAVCAQEGWGDINSGNDSFETVLVQDYVIGEAQDEDIHQTASFGPSTKYTTNFYIALSVAIIGVLLAALFVYLFLKRPRDRWKTKHPKKSVSVKTKE